MKSLILVTAAFALVACERGAPAEVRTEEERRQAAYDRALADAIAAREHFDTYGYPPPHYPSYGRDISSDLGHSSDLDRSRDSVRIRMAPDGTYVAGTPTLAPDGTYVGGRPTLAPDGTYVGVPETGRD